MLVPLRVLTTSTVKFRETDIIYIQMQVVRRKHWVVIVRNFTSVYSWQHRVSFMIMSVYDYSEIASTSIVPLI